jgi:hypothetical protein
MTDQDVLLEVDVHLEFVDYLRFQAYDSLRRLWWLLPLLFLAGLFSIFVIVLSAVRQDSYLLRDIIPFASMIFLATVVLFANPYLTAKRDYDVNPGLRQVIRYRLHETHLAIISSKLEGKLPWSKVLEVRETASSFFVYVLGSTRAFILPKHEFPGEAEVNSWRELLLVILGAPKCRFHVGAITSRF